MATPSSKLDQIGSTWGFVSWPLPSLIETSHMKPPCKVILALLLNNSFEICGILSRFPPDGSSSDVSFGTTPNRNHPENFFVASLIYSAKTPLLS